MHSTHSKASDALTWIQMLYLKNNIVERFILTRCLATRAREIFSSIIYETLLRPCECRSQIFIFIGQVEFDSNYRFEFT